MTAYPSNSLVVSGSVTAPGAGGAIALLTAPPEGVYEAVVHVALTGTAETALLNIRLREGVGVAPTSVAILPSLSATVQRFVVPQMEVNAGGGNVDVVAIAAATAGAIYNVTLILTRVS